MNELDPRVIVAHIIEDLGMDPESASRFEEFGVICVLEGMAAVTRELTARIEAAQAETVELSFGADS